MRFSSIYVPLLLLACSTLRGQGELTLPTLSHILESDRYNPALSSQEDGWYIGLPSFGYNAFHTGPGYRDLIQEQRDAPILQIQNLAKDLNGENELLTDFRLQTIKIKRKVGQWSYGFEHEIVFHAQIFYPDELIQLYVDGNQLWIGQTVDIAPSTSIYSYNNYAVPISFRNNKVSFGIRPRVLIGNQFGRTPRTEASIHTSEDFYQLTLTTDYVFENIGIIDFADANLLNYQIEDLQQWDFLSEHLGFGLDLGVNLDMSDQANFAFSISDLGYIKWKGVRSFESQKVTEYAGVEIIDLFELGQIDLEGALDSLDAIFDVEVKEQEVRFELPLKWHTHFSYQLNEVWLMSTSFSYQASLLRPWNIGVAFTGEIQSNFYVGASLLNRYGDLALGLHSSLRWGRLTGFLISDQLLRGINPLKANHFSLRGGINVRL